MRRSRNANPPTEDCLDLIRQQLIESLPSKWSWKTKDLEDGLAVLKISLHEYLQSPAKWEKCAHWIFGLSEAIARMSVSLSTHAEDIAKGGTISRHAFLLAAVLVCNSCKSRIPGGKPCSKVVVGSFPRDAQAILDLFHEAYEGSGLFPLAPRTPGRRPRRG